MRRLLIALLTLTMAACGGGSPAGPGFSETTRTLYLEGCTADNPAAFCACTLAALEDRFTEPEYLRLAVNGTDELEAAFVEISRLCLAEADPGA